MENKIEAVIFDWAGTTVDYGCFAPVEVFIKVFKNRGIDITLAEAREPMGMLKIDHIRALTKMPRIAEAWKDKYGAYPTEEDVVSMYHEFEPSLLSILPEFTTPNPGVVETVGKLREAGLKIGSTTGYTESMMAIVTKGAKEKGYEPDCYFTPDGLPGGRPYPWMMYENAKKLGVFPMSHIVKVGDTKSDVKEGVNAGAWSIGVVLGSNEMGLHKEEAEALSPKALKEKMEEVTKIFYENGAHYVINEMSELPAAIAKINEALSKGEPVHVIKD